MILRATRALVLALVALVVGFACRPAEPVGGFDPVAQGSHVGGDRPVEGPAFWLFRSRAAWEREREGVLIEPAAAARLDAVDFSRHSIGLFVLGQRPTGGYAIRLDDIAAGPPVRFVLSERKPGPGEIVTLAMTRPFQLVILEARAVPEDAVFELDGRAVAFARRVLE